MYVGVEFKIEMEDVLFCACVISLGICFVINGFVVIIVVVEGGVCYGKLLKHETGISYSFLFGVGYVGGV